MCCPSPSDLETDDVADDMAWWGVCVCVCLAGHGRSKECEELMEEVLNKGVQNRLHSFDSQAYSIFVDSTYVLFSGEVNIPQMG